MITKSVTEWSEHLILFNKSQKMAGATDTKMSV
jgi:hypothetical protein